MDIFDLDRALIGRYEAFARSFSEIHAPEIRAQVDATYAEQRFWPEPLISSRTPSCTSRTSVPVELGTDVPLLPRVDAAIGWGDCRT